MMPIKVETIFWKMPQPPGGRRWRSPGKQQSYRRKKRMSKSEKKKGMTSSGSHLLRWRTASA